MNFLFSSYTPPYNFDVVTMRPDLGWSSLAHSQLCHTRLALRMCELLCLVMLPLQRLYTEVGVPLEGTLNPKP